MAVEEEQRLWLACQTGLLLACKSTFLKLSCQKPCRVEGSEMNSQFEKECPGPEDTCDVGPFPIMVNGSLRLSATFCTHRPVPDNDERSWTDRWVNILLQILRDKNISTILCKSNIKRPPS